MPNSASIATSISPITSSALLIPNASEQLVGATVVDKLNNKFNKIVDKFLSPYFGNEDVVNFFEPQQYHYLPPQAQTY